MKKITQRLGVAFVWSAIAAVGFVGTSCDRPKAETPANPPPNEAADLKRRTQEAEALYNEACASDVSKKPEILRRLTALYDDLPKAADAYFELVLYSLQSPDETPMAALKAAKTYSVRRPLDPRVSEGFRILCTQIVGRPGLELLLADALEAWSSYLEARDAADDAPKSFVHSELVDVRLWQSKWKEAEVMIETALGNAETARTKRVELLVRLGDLRAYRLDDQVGARQAFGRAFSEAEEVLSTSSKMFGYTPTAIAEHLCIEPIARVAAVMRGGS